MSPWQRVLAFVCVLVAAAAPRALAQPYYPLEITQPPADNGPNHRAKWAAPGLPYSAQVAVVSGVWPYQFSLTNAPAGMTIRNAAANETCGIGETGRTHVICGEITWPNPQGPGSVTPTVTVRDAAGATVTRTFTIQVSLGPFRFVDATTGRNARGNNCYLSCGAGTEADPWKSLKDVSAGSSAGTITYFKNGRYTVADLTRFSIGGEGDGVEFKADKSTTWLAYPGHTPVFDFGFSTGQTRVQVWLWGGMVYVEGLTLQNGGTKFFHVLGDAAQAGTFRKNIFRDLNGNGVSNAAMVMTPHSTMTTGLLIQDNQFLDSPGELAVRLYDTTKSLVEGNVMRGIGNAFDPKDAATRFTFRGNTINNIRVDGRYPGTGISGSFNNNPTAPGEIYRNLFYDIDEAAIEIGLTWTRPGGTGPLYVYDNTILSNINVTDIQNPAGPFTFTRNVIVNGEGGHPPVAYFRRPSGFNQPDWSRIQASNNLTGSPSAGLVSATGQLTGRARSQWLGQRGYELGSGSPKAPEPPAKR